MTEQPRSSARSIRVIARLDIKAPYLIKGVNLEGVRKIGLPNEFANRYFKDGADEILYMDAVASLYNRSSIEGVVTETAQNVFVPMTVGGGLRSLDDVHRMMRSGADKVGINTAAIKRKGILGEVARAYGQQAMVLSVEAKRLPGEKRWEAYIDGGREKTGKDAIEWIAEACEAGVGEILLTSVDHEGMTRGYDIDLVRAVHETVAVPIIASGGMGKPEHMLDVVDAGASAVAMAHVLHYNVHTISELKAYLASHGKKVRI